LTSKAAHLAYPISGIPVLLIDEARVIDKDWYVPIRRASNQVGRLSALGSTSRMKRRRKVGAGD
jgi:hypothetical protein